MDARPRRASRPSPRGTAKFLSHVPLRGHDSGFQLSPVPGATDHRQADPAVVRRFGGGVDHLPGVFSVGAPGRLCLFGFFEPPATENPDQPAYRALAGQPGVAADRSRHRLETERHGRPLVAHSGPVDRHHRPALLHAVDHRPAGAKLVRARTRRPAGGQAGVPVFRVVELRFDPGSPGLPVRHRNLGLDAHPGHRLEQRLWIVRRVVRGLGLARAPQRAGRASGSASVTVGNSGRRN